MIMVQSNATNGNVISTLQPKIVIVIAEGFLSGVLHYEW